MAPTILLVEDNEVTRKLVRFALERSGHEVIEASSGEAALDAVDASTPDLILQDLILPDVDGFALTAMLRERVGADVPILAFSGFVSRLDEARISAVGFDDIVVKPIEPSRLVKVIRAHLPAPPAAIPQFGAGKSLVVADDDPIQLKLAMHRLGQLGFEIVAASDGREALARARATQPSAIVSDILMPGLDGFRVCRAMKEDPTLRDIPVLLMTSSYVEEADRELARQAGASSCVLRTPDFAEVIAELDRVLAAPGEASSEAAIDPAFDREHLSRVVRQLERQVAINSGISQRCALLASELSILAGISSALSAGARVADALDEILDSFFDAAGVSTGMLLLFADDARHARTLGLATQWDARELADFFGEEDELRRLLEPGLPLALPLDSGQLAATHRALERVGIRSALIVPVAHGVELFGALLISSNGTVVTGEDRVAFTSGVAGQIALGLALARAFDAKELAERDAREKAARLEAIVASMSDGVVVAQTDGRFLLWNPSAEEILGLGTAEVPPGDWPAHCGLFMPDQTTPFAAEELPLSRAIEGETVTGEQIFVRNDQAPDGRWVDVNARPLVVDGDSCGGVAVFRDITAEKSASEQLLVSERMASVGTLAAGVAHEINNPLAAVMGNLHLALQGVTRAAQEPIDSAAILREVTDELADASEATDRIRDIVRDLKIFSRVEQQHTGPVDVQRSIESALRMAWNEIRHRARVVKSYAAIVPVEATESKLGQVFLNILVNAAQALPEGHAASNEIRLSTSINDDGWVVVTIADTGPGIPPEVMKRLFTPFFTTKPVGVGTGLGLAICRRIVTGFGGAIDVSSAPGNGTAVRITLPPAQSKPAAETAEPAPTPARRRGRVLVIDDEAIIAAVIRRVLAAEHDVAAVTSARDAIVRLRDGERFDVILCDLMMPHMSGMDFFEALVELDRSQADNVVFLTGGAFTTAAREFLDQVPNLRIEKPFDPMQLRTLVNDRVR